MWSDELRPASFRGVLFHVDVGEQNGGRRTGVHEFPYSEQAPYTEDLGKKGLKFTVDGHLVGDDYDTQLKALLYALEAEGPGELNHPYFGIRTVIVDDYRTRQSGREGGYATVAVTFIETSTAPTSPVATANHGAALTAHVEATKARAAEAFIAATPELADAGGLSFGAVRDMVTGALAQVQAALDVAAVPPSVFAEFSRLLTVPGIDTSALTAPAAFFPALIDAVLSKASAALTDAASLVTNPVQRLLDLRKALELPESASDEEIATFAATTTLFERMVLATAAQALGELEFPTYEDAIAQRRLVTAAIESHVLEVSDDTHAAFVDLRVALATAVPGVESSLPRLQQYTPPATLPSLVLAYRLHGDLAAEESLLQRNRVRHPAFVPGGRTLEVLSRE